AYNLVSQYTGLPADEAYPKAKAAAERAIALDPDNGGAYAALAFNVFYWQRDAARSVKLFEKAVALDPGNARAHHWYAMVAMHDRQFHLALREIQAAQRLQPQSAAILANKGLILFHAGRVEEALSVLRPLSQTEANLLSPHAYLATIYLAQERYQDFLREYRRAALLAASPTELALVAVADQAYAAGGGRAMLAAMLEEQKRQFADGKEPAFKLALTAAMLGEKTSALDYLDIAAKRREQDILGIGLEPALKPLREDGRYRMLVAKAGFSPP
ncbi:MAG TPA: CDC27 family protein, partial [Rhizomicrobium sp.]|nr:CDC27 family protein [Rhizomicrobium sp.]